MMVKSSATNSKGALDEAIRATARDVAAVGMKVRRFSKSWASENQNRSDMNSYPAALLLPLRAKQRDYAKDTTRLPSLDLKLH